MDEKNTLNKILQLLMKARDNQFLAKEIGIIDIQDAITWLHTYIKNLG